VRVEPGPPEGPPGSLLNLVRERVRGGSEAWIWTGHQAEFWHPGIMSKYLAAESLRTRLEREGVRAKVAWLVVDQDTNAAWKIPYPGLVKGALTRSEWTLPPASARGGDVPTGALPPATTRGVGEAEPALECVREGLDAIGRALKAHASAASLARQVTEALGDLLAPWCKPDRVVYASELWRDESFARLLEEIRRDPAKCVAAYNRAAASVPRARVRPLSVEGSRVELPLWRLEGAGKPRRPVWSDELDGLKVEELSPRALLMTAAVRSASCDLFIHGMGGGVYDRITERWFAEWMPGVSLAPTAVVTATVRLPFDVRVRTPEEIARARWRAHAARHSPALLGDEAGERRRRELAEAVRRAGSKDATRDAFATLQAFLREYRERNEPRLRELKLEAEQAAQDTSVAGIVHERTWPFPLYPKAILDGLNADVAHAVGGGG